MILARRRLLRDTAMVCATALLNACGGHAATPTATAPPIPTVTATTPGAAPVSPAATAHSAISLSVSAARIDETIRISLAGFPPDRDVTLRSQARDDLGGEWDASAIVHTDGGGAADLTAQAPRGGTYTGIDPMGLFWSLTPPAGGDVPGFPFVKDGVAPNTVAITAEVDGTAVADASLTWRFAAPDAVRSSAHDQGLVGVLFMPPGPGPFPGVIVVGGSEGKLSEYRAAMLAAHGFAALSLAYFGLVPLPQSLANIPLEYFGTALDWLAGQPGVDGERLAMLGKSRGGELALLVGATFPRVKAVVGYVASGLIWPGYGSGTGSPPPAWTYRGVPLPAVAGPLPPDVSKAYQDSVASGKPVAQTPLYPGWMRDTVMVERATIPVEKINGPVLLISGEDDQLWPSYTFSRMVMERLGKASHPYPDAHLHYKDAGHAIGIPYLPTTVHNVQSSGAPLAYGGTPAGYALANADSWPRVLSFLHTHLDRSG